MTKFQHACRQPDLTAHQLHQLIHANQPLHREILSRSQEITAAASSLTKAIIVLGPNTIKNMALETIDKK